MLGCQDCGHYYSPDYNGGSIDGGCPSCGSYRSQPTPIHSEMEARDMPGPAASGLEDQGGNPLKEGILADGGWNNRMKRDESFASVKTAEQVPGQVPAKTVQMGIHNDVRMGLTRLAHMTKKAGPLELQGTVTPRWEEEGGPFEIQGPWHDHAGGCTKSADPQYIESGECAETCNAARVPHGAHFEGQVNHPRASFAALGAEIVSKEHAGPLKAFEEERAARKRQEQGQVAASRLGSDDEGWDDEEDENPYNPDTAAVKDRFIVTPEGKVLRGEGSNGEPAFHEQIAEQNGMHNGEFTKGHSLGVVHGNNSITLVQHPHDSPHSEQQIAAMLADHYPGHTLNPVKATSNEERWGVGQEASPDERYQKGFGGPEERDKKIQEAEQARGGKPFGHYDNPYMNRGGSVNESMRERFYQPWSHDTTSIDADFDVEQIIPPGHHTVEVSVDGEKNPVILQHDNSDALDAAKTKLEAGVSDLSNPGFDDTDDPEHVDQHEFNDGEDQGLYDQTSGAGGSDIGQALEEAMPSLDAHDPAVQKLIEAIQDHPGHSTHEQLVHRANGLPGVGMPPSVVPGATPMNQAPANPMATSTPCPHCGALGAPSGNCLQCGMPLMQAPTGQAGPVPAGNPAPMAGPPQAQPITAANQGPHNPEQFKAVKDYLTQNTPPEQLPQVLQDLIDNPDNYGDVLSQIQGKGQPPQPDPDQGAPPPMPPQQDPNAQAPPGMMPPPMSSVKTAEHPFGVPAADQQGQRDVSQENDSSGYWKTADKTPLQVGAEYEMYSNQYDIPDIIRVDAIKPESIEYTLTGEYGLEHRTELTRSEAEMEATTFQPAGAGDHADDETKGDTPHQAPHAFAKVKEAADNIAPQCPKCGSHTTETMNSDVHPGNFSCHNCGNVWEIKGVVPTKSGSVFPSVIPGALYPEEEELQTRGRGDQKLVTCPGCGSTTHNIMHGCPHCGFDFNLAPAKTAGAKFTPMEQREFIDEPGVARNKDKLDLSHTHYEQSSLSSDDFLFGL